MSRVSVVLPAYNAEPWVEAAIESVLVQEDVLEVLAGDDASTDGTGRVLEAVARRDGRVRSLRSEVNLGPGEMRRRLVAAARGEFIAFQDADDRSHPDRFRHQVAAFEQLPELALCGTGFRYLYPDGRLGAPIERPATRERILAAIADGVPFCCATLMVRREAIGAIGSFRPYFNRLGNEDLDLAIRIAERFGARNLPEALYECRILATSFSRTRRDPRQEVVLEVTRALAAERAQGGLDALDRGDNAAIERLEARLLEPHRREPSLSLRRRAGAALSVGDRRGALAWAWEAVCTEPLRLANYRAWFYCLRQRTSLAGVPGLDSASSDRGAR